MCQLFKHSWHINSPLLFLIVLLSSANIFGQNKGNFYELYQAKEYAKLQKQYADIKGLLTTSEQIFYKAIFTKDAEKAFNTYKDLFATSTGKLKYFCGERLKDYYYARGYYSTASDYEKYLVDNHHLIDEDNQDNINSEVTVEDKESLFIQVGAFGLEENANQMKEMLRTQKIKSKIKVRLINKNKLYCVWVIGKDDFKNTLQFADELKREYHLDYKIIKE